MSRNLRSLVEEYRAFYEVLPYYVFLEEEHGSRTDKSTRRIQAGFDVDIFGMNIRNEVEVPGPDSDYALAYTELQKIADNISRRHSSDACSLSVIPFAERAVLDSRSHARVQAMLRIRISHSRGLDRPAGVSEQYALKEVETQLQGFGLARR
jgi:hypothetical protein